MNDVMYDVKVVYKYAKGNTLSNLVKASSPQEALSLGMPKNVAQHHHEFLRFETPSGKPMKEWNNEVNKKDAEFKKRYGST